MRFDPTGNPRDFVTHTLHSIVTADQESTQLDIGHIVTDLKTFIERCDEIEFVDSLPEQYQPGRVRVAIKGSSYEPTGPGPMTNIVAALSLVAERCEARAKALALLDKHEVSGNLERFTHELVRVIWSGQRVGMSGLVSVLEKSLAVT